MGSKNNPGAHDCLANAHPDEPMFVLLGRDPSAHLLVRLWAVVRGSQGEDPAMVQEARDCADAMRAWTIKLGKAKRLDETTAVFDGLVLPPSAPTVCHFCGKSRAEVGKLITGATDRRGAAGICDECVQLSVEILLSEARHPTEPVVPVARTYADGMRRALDICTALTEVGGNLDYVSGAAAVRDIIARDIETAPEGPADAGSAAPERKS